MPTGPDLPSAAMLTQIAADYGIDLTAAEADSYRSLMAGAINSYRRLEDFAEPKPNVKYRRDGAGGPKAMTIRATAGTGAATSRARQAGCSRGSAWRSRTWCRSPASR